MDNWYNLDKESVLKEMKSDLHNGLTAAEVENRTKVSGLNKFAEKKKETLISQIFRQLKDVAVIILLIAAALSFALEIKELLEGHNVTFVEPTVILAIVIMNVILAVTQERGAEKALEALAVLNSPSCYVIRDGNKQEIDTTLVVPGDIIVMKTGDLVPADARIITCESFAVDEASLTGESEPSEKNEETLTKENAPLGDRLNMVFSGCLVVSGYATAVVTSTGMNTEIGRIAGYLNHTKKNKTPLQLRLDKLGKMISTIAIIAAFSIFMIGLLNGQDTWDLIMLAVTLAVAAVPETLALIVTLMLTHGVKKMVGKNALIRKLQAVETLGSTSVICSDKTGTLTQNKMTIKRMWIYGEEPISDTNVNSPEHYELLKRFLLASNVTAEKNERGETKIIGDPTESAIMRLSIKMGLNRDDLDADYKKVAEIPFSSARKMMTAIYKKPDGRFLVLTKGAFDKIPYIKKDLSYAKELNDKHDSFAQDALRVITLASKEIDSLPAKEDLEKLEADLNFEGFIGLIDPPRPEAAAAIKRAKKAGVRTIMITGDHAVTASAIARELGIIAAKEGIITGEELGKLSDEEFFESIEFYSVYARVSPSDKIRIVQAWQQKGAVVSMTGDGVNDAPALKAADVGVSMGINGTEVAKSASDMVLTDDNFSTIVEAVSEGRQVFANIKKLVYFLIVCNISEIVVMIFGQVSGWGVPVTPILLLIINVLGDGIPGLALAKEQSDTRIMARKPIDREESFFSGGLMEVIIQQTIMCSIVVLAAFYIGKFVDIQGAFEPSHKLGQTMAFLVLGWTSILHIFVVRSRASIFKRSLKDNPQLIISAVIMLFVLVAMAAIPPVASGLGLVAMDTYHWLICIGISLLPLLIAEYGKFWDNYKYHETERLRVKQQKIH
ncbi:MAG: cation-translocating P-type ATPase [Treponema sp.]|nr:cation-translocating P-type ATPase [Treponema sp.]MCL2250453.1 cation-translocating P-type ATPase [Treponema sp.]